MDIAQQEALRQALTARIADLLKEHGLGPEFKEWEDTIDCDVVEGEVLVDGIQGVLFAVAVAFA